MNRTPFAGLTAVAPDESPYEDGASFLQRNPAITDYLLRLGAKTHRHNGLDGLVSPGVAPTITLNNDGFLPSERSFFVGFTLVDADGGETTVSPLASATTPVGIPAPTTRPTVVVASGGGVPLGPAFYAVSRIDDGGGETPLGPSTSVTINRPSLVTLTGLDALRGPDADHLGVYKSVGGQFYWVGPAYGDTFADDGTLCADCTREPVLSNTTNTTWSLQLEVPAAVASGATSVRIYASSLETLESPSLLVELASGSLAYEMKNTQFMFGSPPPVNLSKGGANLIDPDTELLDWHWKRSVTASGNLPPGVRGDVRVVLSPTPQLYAVPSASAAGPTDWVPLALIGPRGPQGYQGIQGIPGPQVTDRGTWVGSGDYDQYDSVNLAGASYWAKVAIPPGSEGPLDPGNDWVLLASGAAGPRGPGLNWRGIYDPTAIYTDGDLVNLLGSVFLTHGDVAVGTDPSSGGVFHPNYPTRQLQPVVFNQWNSGHISTSYPTWFPFSSFSTRAYYFDVLASGHVTVEENVPPGTPKSNRIWRFDGSNQWTPNVDPMTGAALNIEADLPVGRYMYLVDSNVASDFTFRFSGTATLSSADGYWEPVFASASIIGAGHTIQDEGADLPARANLNFVGAAVSVTDDPSDDRTVVTITAASGSSTLAIQDTGVGLTPRGALNFIGATVSDDPTHNRVNVTVGSGGGGGGGASGALSWEGEWFDSVSYGEGSIVFVPDSGKTWVAAHGDPPTGSVPGEDPGDIVIASRNFDDNDVTGITDRGGNTPGAPSGHLTVTSGPLAIPYWDSQPVAGDDTSYSQLKYHTNANVGQVGVTIGGTYYNAGGVALYLDYSAGLLKIGEGVYYPGNWASVTPGSFPLDGWLRLQRDGNDLIGTLYDTDPATGDPPIATVTYTLTGADATNYGAGVDLKIGVYGQNGASGPTNLWFDDLMVVHPATGGRWELLAGPPVPDPRDDLILLDETFDGTLTAYTPDFGTSLTGLLASGGILSSTDSNDHSFHDASVSVVDAIHLIKFNNNGGGATIFLAAKYIDDNNLLFMQYIHSSSPKITCYQRVGGSYASLGSLSTPGDDVGWMVIRMTGNMVAFEYHGIDPRFRGQPSSLLEVLLTGGAATALGAGVAGNPGMRLTGDGGTGSTPATVDEWVVARPAVRRGEF